MLAAKAVSQQVAAGPPVDTVQAVFQCRRALEDVDRDGNPDVDEDVNGNGVLDDGEDVDGDGNLDSAEDADGDGELFTGPQEWESFIRSSDVVGQEQVPVETSLDNRQR